MSNHTRLNINIQAFAPVIVVPEQLEDDDYDGEYFDGDGDGENGRTEMLQLMKPPDLFKEALRVMLVIDLGTFQIKSQNNQKKSNNENKKQKSSTTTNTIGSQHHPSAFRIPSSSTYHHNNHTNPSHHHNSQQKQQEAFYDRYLFSMSNMQVMLLRNSKNIWDGKKLANSSSKIISHVNCSIALHLSILPQDPTLTRLKIVGSMPTINIVVTTRTRRQLLQLLMSLNRQSAKILEKKKKQNRNRLFSSSSNSYG
jgi:hypothetical protein